MEAREAAFHDNLTSIPQFVNPGAVEDRRADGGRMTFGDFALTENSVGRNQAVPLTKVRESATNSLDLTVDDTLFFCDGFGVVEGDRIAIETPTGLVKTRITTRIDDRRVKVFPAVTVAAGANVWLGEYGVARDMGVVAA